MVAEVEAVEAEVAAMAVVAVRVAAAEEEMAGVVGASMEDTAIRAVGEEGTTAVAVAVADRAMVVAATERSTIPKRAREAVDGGAMATLAVCRMPDGAAPLPI